MTGDVAPPEFFPFLQICIDSAFILPQYLVLWKLLVRQVEWLLPVRSRRCKSCKGKSFTEDSSRWQPRRKQKRRNTNRLRNVPSHGPRILTSLSGEAPLERRFLLRIIRT